MDENMKLAIAGGVAVVVLLIAVSVLKMVKEHSQSGTSDKTSMQSIDISHKTNAYNKGTASEARIGTKARVATRKRKHSYYFPKKKSRSEIVNPVEVEPLEDDPSEEKFDEQGYKIYSQEEIREQLSLMESSPVSMDGPDESIDLGPTGMVRIKDEMPEAVNEPVPDEAIKK